MAAQPRVIDLLPRKPLSLVLLFLTGVLAIAAVETLYYWMPRLAAHATDGRIAAFDLDSEGSLGAWFSSLLLLSCALVSLHLWSLRRHRSDDYHGHYRVWLWAAFVWFVMSLDEACSLHEGFKELMSHSTGQRLLGDGSLWWIMAYGLVLGVLGIRLFFEVRACRSATTLFVLAGLTWAAAIAWQLELLMPRSGARGVMVEEGCEMLGDLVLLLALVVYTRYVLMDVEGLLPRSEKRKKSKRVKTAETEATVEASEGKKRDDLSSVASTPAASAASTSRTTSKQVEKATPATKPTSAPTSRRIDAAEDPLAARKLSRAERRAQRRAGRDDD